MTGDSLFTADVLQLYLIHFCSEAFLARHGSNMFAASPRFYPDGYSSAGHGWSGIPATDSEHTGVQAPLSWLIRSSVVFLGLRRTFRQTIVLFSPNFAQFILQYTRGESEDRRVGKKLDNSNAMRYYHSL